MTTDSNAAMPLTTPAGTPLPPPVAPDAKALMDKALCLVVRRGKFGVRRKARAVQIDNTAPMALTPANTGAVVTDANPAMLSVSKKLFACPEYAAIGILDGQVRQYLQARCLPSMFRKGFWLLPLDLIDDVWARLEQFKAERQAKIDAFLAVYVQVSEDAQQQLKSMYDPTQYPSLERVAGAFHFSWQLISFDVPGKLKQLRKDLYDAERQKMADNLQAAAEDIQAGLRVAMLELVKGMASSLEGQTEDGKKKKFYSSKLERLTQFLDLFKARNITDDGELANLVSQARALIDGVDAEMIRDSDDLRDAMGEEFKNLGESLTGLVGSGPRRFINLDDDDED
jgi:hypothetical protein